MEENLERQKASREKEIKVEREKASKVELNNMAPNQP
jgi:hypothetical protein